MKNWFKSNFRIKKLDLDQEFCLRRLIKIKESLAETWYKSKNENLKMNNWLILINH
jgi:hypothetical protein